MNVGWLKRLSLFLEFFFAGSVRWSLYMAFTAMACWFFITDFWLARFFNVWPDPAEYVFLVPAILIPIAFAAFFSCSSTHVRLPHNMCHFDPSQPMTLAQWDLMILDASFRTRSHAVREMLRWQRRKIAGVGSRDLDEVAMPRWSLPGLWRKGMKHYLRLAWFPFLLAFLASPVPTKMIDSAGAARSSQLVCGVSSGPHNPEMHTSAGRSCSFSLDYPMPYPGRWIEVTAADFPRAYLRVRVICGKGCQVRDPEGNFDVLIPSASTSTPLRLRGGKARFFDWGDSNNTGASFDIAVTKPDGITVLQTIQIR